MNDENRPPPGTNLRERVGSLGRVAHRNNSSKTQAGDTLGDVASRSAKPPGSAARCSSGGGGGNSGVDSLGRLDVVSLILKGGRSGDNVGGASKEEAPAAATYDGSGGSATALPTAPLSLAGSWSGRSPAHPHNYSRPAQTLSASQSLPPRPRRPSSSMSAGGSCSGKEDMERGSPWTLEAERARSDSLLRSLRAVVRERDAMLKERQTWKEGRSRAEGELNRWERAAAALDAELQMERLHTAREKEQAKALNERLQATAVAMTAAEKRAAEAEERAAASAMAADAARAAAATETRKANDLKARLRTEEELGREAAKAVAASEAANSAAAAETRKRAQLEVRVATAEECLRRMLSEKNAALATRDGRITELQRELSAANDALAASSQRCAGQARELASLTQHLEETTAAAAVQKAEILAAAAAEKAEILAAAAAQKEEMAACAAAQTAVLVAAAAAEKAAAAAAEHALVAVRGELAAATDDLSAARSAAAAASAEGTAAAKRAGIAEREKDVLAEDYAREKHRMAESSAARLRDAVKREGALTKAVADGTARVAALEEALGAAQAGEMEARRDGTAHLARARSAEAAAAEALTRAQQLESLRTVLEEQRGYAAKLCRRAEAMEAAAETARAAAAREAAAAAAALKELAMERAAAAAAAAKAEEMEAKAVLAKEEAVVLRGANAAVAARFREAEQLLGRSEEARVAAQLAETAAAARAKGSERGAEAAGQELAQLRDGFAPLWAERDSLRERLAAKDSALEELRGRWQAAAAELGALKAAGLRSSRDDADEAAGGHVDFVGCSGCGGGGGASSGGENVCASGDTTAQDAASLAPAAVVEHDAVSSSEKSAGLSRVESLLEREKTRRLVTALAFAAWRNGSSGGSFHSAAAAGWRPPATSSSRLRLLHAPREESESPPLVGPQRWVWEASDGAATVLPPPAGLVRATSMSPVPFCRPGCNSPADTGDESRSWDGSSSFRCLSSGGGEMGVAVAASSAAVASTLTARGRLDFGRIAFSHEALSTDEKGNGSLRRYSSAALSGEEVEAEDSGRISSADLSADGDGPRGGASSGGVLGERPSAAAKGLPADGKEEEEPSESSEELVYYRRAGNTCGGCGDGPGGEAENSFSFWCLSEDSVMPTPDRLTSWGEREANMDT